MTEKRPNTDSKAVKVSSPISALPEEQDKLHATLEERIYTIIGKELLAKDYRPTAYAEAVLMSAGDENHIIYNYAKLRYKDLYATATRRLKHSNELKGGS
jgi:hypothetical protein